MPSLKSCLLFVIIIIGGSSRAKSQLRLIDSLQNRLQQNIHDTDRINTQFYLVTTLMFRHEVPDRKKKIDSYARSTMSLAKKTGENFWLGKAYLLLASIEYYSGQVSVSIDHVDSALAFFVKTNRWSYTAYTYSFKSGYSAAAGNYEEYAKSINKAIEISTEHNDLWNLGVAYYLTAMTNAMQENYAEALEFGLKAMELLQEYDTKFRKPNPYSVSNKFNTYQAYQTVGYTYYLMGKYSEATDYFNKGFALFGDESTNYDKSLVKATLGNNHFKEGKYQLAIDEYTSSIELAKSIEHNWPQYEAYLKLAEINSSLADIQHRVGNKDSALKLRHMAISFTDSALFFARADEYDLNICEGLIAKGQFLLAASRIGEAKLCFDSALTIGQKYRTNALIQRIYTGLAVIDSTTGNFRHGTEMQKLAQRYKDSSNNERKRRSFELIEAQNKIEKNQRKINQLKAENNLLTTQSTRHRQTRIAAILAFLFFSVLGILIWRSYKQKRQIVQQMVMQNERLDISLRLTKDIGNTVSELVLATDEAQQHLNRQELIVLNDKMATIQSSSGEIVNRLGSIVATLKSGN